jgi:hypothetical protein
MERIRLPLGTTDSQSLFARRLITSSVTGFLMGMLVLHVVKIFELIKCILHRRPLKDGDIINVDVTVFLNG